MNCSTTGGPWDGENTGEVAAMARLRAEEPRATSRPPGTSRRRWLHDCRQAGARNRCRRRRVGSSLPVRLPVHQSRRAEQQPAAADAAAVLHSAGRAAGADAPPVAVLPTTRCRRCTFSGRAAGAALPPVHSAGRAAADAAAGARSADCATAPHNTREATRVPDPPHPNWRRKSRKRQAASLWHGQSQGRHEREL